MSTQSMTAPAVDQQRLVGPFREFDPRIELPRWLDEYKWHPDEATWSQCARDWTADRLLDPHYPKVWRTRRPNNQAHLPPGSGGRRKKNNRNEYKL